MAFRPLQDICACLGMAAFALTTCVPALAGNHGSPQIRPSIYDNAGPYAGPLFSLNKFSTEHSGYSVGPTDVDGDGKLVGAVFGYKFPYRRAYLALEADVAFGKIEGSNTGTSVRSDFVSTVRLRAGPDLDGLIPYATAGLAIAGINSHSNLFLHGRTSTVFGFAIGAGVEKPLWRAVSGRLEYLYMHLPSSSGPAIDDLHVLRASLLFHLRP